MYTRKHFSDNIKNTMIRKCETDAGAPIRFIGGIYDGKMGWINKTKQATLKRIYVIVQLDDGSQKRTFVAKKNGAERHKTPKTYTEAIFQQQPKLEKQLNDLCAQLAKCGVGADCDIKEVMPIIEQKLTNACEEQNALGHNTEYKHIEFEKHDDLEML